MMVGDIEVPDIDLTSKVKANLANDVRAAMSVEKDIETLEGAPVIRRSLAKPIPPQASFPKEVVNTSITDYDAFRATLKEDEMALFDEYIKMEGDMPKGITAIDLIKIKQSYGSFYFLPLASGPYLYRALTAAEDKKIKGIKGLTQSAYMNHVVSTCVLAPPLTLVEVENSGLAGTKNSLYEQILIFSDFATNETTSIKL